MTHYKLGMKKDVLISCPAPEGEKPSALYELKVNGVPVFVYEARVSARPENQVWPGYQRPLDQTELAAFACWDMAGPVEVEIVSRRPVEQVTVRPLARDIKPLVDSNVIAFTISEPAPIVVEVNDFHGALHLFPSPPEADPPRPDSPDVKYFGPGIHNAGRIVLKDNETAYIAGGAVVHGVIHAENARNVKVLGRGILDASTIERGSLKNMIWFEKCRDVQVSGIVLRDPHSWAAKPTNCDGVRFENVKLIGCWRYNSDGFDFVDCRDVLVSRCFVRSFDDSIVVKSFGGEGSIHDVTVEECVVWTDWGVSLGITYETRTDSIRDVMFRNCDILHNMACRAALTLNPNDRSLIQDVCFEDIRVEDARSGLIELVVEKTKYGKDKERGRIKGVEFKNISVTGGPSPHSCLAGFDADHAVENISFENLRIHGKLILDADSGGFKIGPHVRHLSFTCVK